MKTILIALSLISANCFADQWVNGYYKSNGTYVEGHHRSSPNHTVTDNYSYSGNTNPYTGTVGTKSYDDSYPSYNHQNNHKKTNSFGY